MTRGEKSYVFPLLGSLYVHEATSACTVQAYTDTRRIGRNLSILHIYDDITNMLRRYKRAYRYVLLYRTWCPRYERTIIWNARTVLIPILLHLWNDKIDFCLAGKYQENPGLGTQTIILANHSTWYRKPYTLRGHPWNQD